MENQNNEQVVEQKITSELSREEKLAKILEGVNEQGKTLTVVAKELGYKNSDGVGKFLKRANYVKKGKKYVYKGESEEKNENKKDNEVSIEDILIQLKTISERLDNLEKKDTNGMMVSNKEMKYKSTTIRVDEQTLTDFNNVCNSFSNIDKSYLITLALQEFVDKYGK